MQCYFDLSLFKFCYVNKHDYTVKQSADNQLFSIRNHCNAFCYDAVWGRPSYIHNFVHIFHLFNFKPLKPPPLHFFQQNNKGVVFFYFLPLQRRLQTYEALSPILTLRAYYKLYLTQ